MEAPTCSVEGQYEQPQAPVKVRRHLNRVRRSTPAIPTEPKTIGERMVHRRFALGLTQAQVSAQILLQAKHSGMVGKRSISRNGYCMYEIGKSEPKLRMIESIAAALGVSPGWLAFGIEDKSGTASNPPPATIPLTISFSWSGLGLSACSADQTSR